MNEEVRRTGRSGKDVKYVNHTLQNPKILATRKRRHEEYLAKLDEKK